MIVLPLFSYGEYREVYVSLKDLMIAVNEYEEWVECMNLELKDMVLSGYIKSIVEKLRIAAGMNDHFWVRVLRFSEPNAFSFANGSIHISAGLFNSIDNEAQLALLLAHEMYHTSLGHHIKRRYELHEKSYEVTRNRAAWSILGTGGTADKALQRAMSGFSKKLETEADNNALLLVMKAGYNAWESLGLFINLNDRFEKDSIQYDSVYATHPRLLDRLKTCRAALTRLSLDSSLGVHNRDQYLRTVTPAILEGCDLFLRDGEVDNAIDIANSIIEYDRSLARAHETKAKAFFIRGKKDDLDSSFLHYREALEMDSSRGNLFKDVGYVLLKQGKFKEAKNYLQHYLDLNPDAEDTAYIMYYLKKNYE